MQSRDTQKLNKQNTGGGTVDSTLTRQPSGGTDRVMSRVMNQCWKDHLRPRKGYMGEDTPNKERGDVMTLTV